MQKTFKVYKHGWYAFTCQKEPKQIEIGMLPRPPYRWFETYEQAKNFLEKGNKLNPLEESILTNLNNG